jgi:hypothetical protein
MPMVEEAEPAGVAVETRPECLLRLSGGLGNQLFQYAAGRSLALKSAAKLVLDVSFYDTGRHRSFELNSFPIHAEVQHNAGRGTSLSRVSGFLRSFFGRRPVYHEPHFHFDPKFSELSPPIILSGYFQSYRYCEGIEPLIRNELRVPEPLDAATRQLARCLADPESTVLHVRRGDYISSSKASRIYAECTSEYYQAAMECIPGNGPVLVLSDDLNWARTHLPRVKPLIFPEVLTNRSGIADLWLMTHAKNHIIANSSFSWWGAWLAHSRNGKKIAPRKWFNDPSVDDRDLIPEDWIRI